MSPNIPAQSIVYTCAIDCAMFYELSDVSAYGSK